MIRQHLSHQLAVARKATMKAFVVVALLAVACQGAVGQYADLGGYLGGYGGVRHLGNGIRQGFVGFQPGVAQAVDPLSGARAQFPVPIPTHLIVAPYPVPVPQPVPVPVPHPVPVTRPYPVPVPQPHPVQVPVPHPVGVPQAVPFPSPVYAPAPYSVYGQGYY